MNRQNLEVPEDLEHQKHLVAQSCQEHCLLLERQELLVVLLSLDYLEDLVLLPLLDCL